MYGLLEVGLRVNMGVPIVVILVLVIRHDIPSVAASKE